MIEAQVMMADKHGKIYLRPTIPTPVASTAVNHRLRTDSSRSNCCCCNSRCSSHYAFFSLVLFLFTISSVVIRELRSFRYLEEPGSVLPSAGLKVFKIINRKNKVDVFFQQVLAFQKSWRSFSPIIVCILAHCMLPF